MIKAAAAGVLQLIIHDLLIINKVSDCMYIIVIYIRHHFLNCRPYRNVIEAAVVGSWQLTNTCFNCYEQETDYVYIMVTYIRDHSLLVSHTTCRLL